MLSLRRHRLSSYCDGFFCLRRKYQDHPSPRPPLPLLRTEPQLPLRKTAHWALQVAPRMFAARTRSCRRPQRREMRPRHDSLGLIQHRRAIGETSGASQGICIRDAAPPAAGAPRMIIISKVTLFPAQWVYMNRWGGRNIRVIHLGVLAAQKMQAPLSVMSG